MPTDKFVGVFGRVAAMAGLREAFATKAYEVTMTLAGDRDRIEVVAAPR